MRTYLYIHVGLDKTVEHIRHKSGKNVNINTSVTHIFKAWNQQKDLKGLKYIMWCWVNIIIYLILQNIFAYLIIGWNHYIYSEMLGWTVMMNYTKIKNMHELKYIKIYLILVYSMTSFLGLKE